MSLKIVVKIRSIEVLSLSSQTHVELTVLMINESSNDRCNAEGSDASYTFSEFDWFDKKLMLKCWRETGRTEMLSISFPIVNCIENGMP